MTTAEFPSPHRLVTGESVVVSPPAVDTTSISSDTRCPDAVEGDGLVRVANG